MEEDAVDQCLTALRTASSDSERTDALLIVEDAVRTKFGIGGGLLLRRVFDAIDFDFVTDVLRRRSGDDVRGRDAAMALLAAFATDPDLVDDDSMLKLMPSVVAILTDSNCSSSGNNDAVMYVCAMSLTSKGQKAIVESRSLARLCRAFEREVSGANSNRFVGGGPSVFDAITNVIAGGGWRQCPPNSFHVLMDALAVGFAAADKASQAKFDRCDGVNAILFSMPTAALVTCTDQLWYSRFYDELMGTLCFRLNEAQRDPLLRLCAGFVDKLDVTWALGDNTERSYRLFLLLVQLACVEIRMALEDQTMVQAAVKAELLAACFLIVERAVQFLVSDGRHAVTFAARHQLYEAITSALAAVLQFITEASLQLEAIVGAGPDDGDGRWYFVCAIMRVIGAWLAEETSALRPEVYAVVPVLLRMCQKDAALRGPKAADSLLYFLLPAFCHLSVEDDPRAVMLAQGLPATITDYVDSLVPTVCAAGDDDDDDDEDGSKSHREEGALTLCCGTLMNIVVLEDGRRVGSDPAFLRLLKLVFASLPAIDKRPHRLVIKGNLAVLGLLLLRRAAAKYAANESSIYRFLSASIRFLWDAFVIDEDFSGNDGGFPRLTLARSYRDFWDDLKELWFLGMQSLSSLLPTIPWIGLFVVESGWTETLITALARVRPDGVEDGVCREYEGFLVCLTRCCDRARVVLLELGATRMCHTLAMTDLERVLRGTVV